MKDKNNLFKYATKELSQDAFLCWSINWLNESEEHPLYNYGKEMLDLFLGENKQEQYYDVQIYRQYEKIDVLVMFKDCLEKQYALIIEDKTNTSERKNQLSDYKQKLIDKDGLKDETIYLSYVKTGIMYDKDMRIIDKGATVVDLEKLFEVVARYEGQAKSEILSDFYEYIKSIRDDRNNIKKLIDNSEYAGVIEDRFGQFYFLDKLFNKRSMKENDNILFWY